MGDYRQAGRITVREAPGFPAPAAARKNRGIVEVSRKNREPMILRGARPAAVLI
jgi:hypothetical protein